MPRVLLTLAVRADLRLFLWCMYIYVYIYCNANGIHGGRGTLERMPPCRRAETSGAKIRSNCGVAVLLLSCVLLDIRGCSRQTSLAKHVLTTFCLFCLLYRLGTPSRRSFALNVRYRDARYAPTPQAMLRIVASRLRNARLKILRNITWIFFLSCAHGNIFPADSFKYFYSFVICRIFQNS